MRGELRLEANTSLNPGGTNHARLECAAAREASPVWADLRR